MSSQTPIAGFQKTSLIDYPGKVCSIIFTAGCNFKCPFCHNSQLVHGDFELIPHNYIFKHLEKRQDVLDAVTITGGEPLLHADIIQLVKKIKNKGFFIKLDTNGSFPDRFKQILEENLIDYAALDYKTTFDNYKNFLGVEGSVIGRSFQLLRDSGISYEFRTTVVPGLIDKEKLLAMAKDLKKGDSWFLQQFKPVNCLDPDYNNLDPYKLEDLEDMENAVKNYIPAVQLRGV